MKLTDVAPVEEWIELEKEISGRTGMNAAVFDADGTRVSDYVNWGNSLCPVVKGHEKGQKFICAVAHQNLAAQAARNGRVVIDACDAGMLKMVVPIFVGGEFLGVAGGCGALDTGETVDAFMVHKTLGLKQERIADLSVDIPMMSRLQAGTHAEFIGERIEQMVSGRKREASI